MQTLQARDIEEIGVQCELLTKGNTGMTGIERRRSTILEANDPGNPFEDNNFVEPKTYIESLRERMNGPNPIDIDYLNNSR